MDVWTDRAERMPVMAKAFHGQPCSRLLACNNKDDDDEQ